MDRTTWRELFSLNAYWVGLSFMWNSLHVIILPAILLHLVPEARKEIHVGLEILLILPFGDRSYYDTEVRGLKIRYYLPQTLLLGRVGDFFGNTDVFPTGHHDEVTSGNGDLGR